jgi:hypothetical protein
VSQVEARWGGGEAMYLGRGSSSTISGWGGDTGVLRAQDQGQMQLIMVIFFPCLRYVEEGKCVSGCW